MTALKVFKVKDDYELDDIQAMVDREAVNLEKFHHPNVVHYYGISRESGTNPSVALVMELLDGSVETLKKNSHGAVPVVNSESARRLLLGASLGLRTIHDRGVVHRDIKGGNVLVRKTQDGFFEGVIGDFGLAMSIASKSSSQNKGSIAGTYQWMAPEQINPVRGRKLTPAADIFSFGVVVWELATGLVPWQEELEADCDHDPRSVLSEIARDGEVLQFPSAPDAKWQKLQDLAFKCFEPDPAQRLSARQVVAFLENLQIPPSGPLNISQSELENIYVTEETTDSRLQYSTEEPKLKLQSSSKTCTLS